MFHEEESGWFCGVLLICQNPSTVFFKCDYAYICCRVWARKAFGKELCPAFPAPCATPSECSMGRRGSGSQQTPKRVTSSHLIASPQGWLWGYQILGSYREKPEMPQIMPNSWLWTRCGRNQIPQYSCYAFHMIRKQLTILNTQKIW